MEIKGFLKSSLLEWEGRLSCVLFLPRCNLRCLYCHAVDLVLDPDSLDTVPLEEVTAHLRENSGWVDGVAITGGEPTLHGPELIDLIGTLREVPVSVLVETNGTRPDWVARLIGEGLVDAMSMDVKAPLTQADYARVTGVEVDVAQVRRSIEIIKGSGLEYEFRITLVPGLVGRGELEGILPALEGSRQIALQNFRAGRCLSEELSATTPFKPAEMDVFEALATPFTDRCVVRGRDHALTA